MMIIDDAHSHDGDDRVHDDVDDNDDKTGLTASKEGTPLEKISNTTVQSRNDS